ncbi:carboxylesterase/lipase family protein [Nocardia jiangsuensis]|uniref:Carboxylesterase/lipase family protein n=1 Tax=Nocardia jiangsuensis TaxID=1691563 RepID=A0ABV8E0Z1_9NOCA
MIEVRSGCGAVRGHRTDGGAVFRGIPYALPPFGPRRFGAPVPVPPWDGVRAALAFGPFVPQPGHPDSIGHLTLNIWSPAPGAARLPVLVWIHGGGYYEGGPDNPHQDGTMLARAGVVLVTLTYRVGVEGFAHLDGAPDNRGILDQLAALHWVRENIAAYGGDPANVTVIGQSAGAGCVAALLAMPAARGLFRRAVPMSVPGTFFTPALAARIAADIAARVGARATRAELSRFAPGALVAATGEVMARMPEYTGRWGRVALTPSPFSPVVDGEVLPCDPWQALAGGAAREVEILTGHTRDEYRLFAAEPGAVTDELIDAAFRWFADHDHYRAAYPDASRAQLHETLHADWLFRMPTLHLADAAHAGGGPVRLYELCWSFRHDQGASHSLDVLLLFGTLTDADARAHPAAIAGAAEQLPALAQQLRDEWVRFARTGDPGWTRYDPHARATRIYGAEVVTGRYPEEPSRAIWREHRFGALTPPG